MKRFTLVEVLVSIAVIAILFGMAIGVTSFVKTKIARSSTQATMKLIEMAFAKYKNEYGVYPYAWKNSPMLLSIPASNFDYKTGSDAADLKADLWAFFNDVTAAEKTAKLASQKYLKESDIVKPPKIRGISLIADNHPSDNSVRKFYFLDGWGNHIIYICPGVFNTESFDLISAGSDEHIHVLDNGSTEKFTWKTKPDFTLGSVDEGNDIYPTFKFEEKAERSKFGEWDITKISDDITNFTKN